MLWSRTLSVAITLCLLATFCLPVSGQTADEYQVKAAFILNFAKFIEWPGDVVGQQDTLVIGVIGDDPFGSVLDQVVSRSSAWGRKLVVRRMQVGDNLRGCHILFISSSERRRVSQIMDHLRGSSVVTIGEMSEFNKVGGLIRFFIQDNKVVFEINATVAVQSRLKVSSKLMALSKAGRN